MSSPIKAIKVYGAGGPNPPKVAMVLEELSVPYEQTLISFTEVKQPEYLAINPNGRIPAIYDPNTELTLWESGAILLYLVERYDTAHKLSFPPGSKEDYLAKQWLFFQASGQGPYYGQAAWFKKFHLENVPSAVERYVKEVNRVTAVVEGHLTKERQRYHPTSTANEPGGPWLVGNQISYADIAFLQWQLSIQMFCSKNELDLQNYPHVEAWLERMTSRPAIKTVMENNERARQQIDERMQK